MVPHGCSDPKTKIPFEWEELGEAEKLCNSGSYTSPGDHKLDKVSSRM